MKLASIMIFQPKNVNHAQLVVITVHIIQPLVHNSVMLAQVVTILTQSFNSAILHAKKKTSTTILTHNSASIAQKDVKNVILIALTVQVNVMSANQGLL